MNLAKKDTCLDNDSYLCVCVCVCSVLMGEKDRNEEGEKSSLHFGIWFHMAKDGHHHLVIHTPGQVQVVRHTLNVRQ